MTVMAQPAMISHSMVRIAEGVIAGTGAIRLW